MKPELIQAIKDFQDGNVKAFETIYSLQFNHIYYIAMQYTKSREAAEDVAQDVFIDVYRSLNQLDTPEHFNAWVNRVVYHTFLKSIRSKQISMRVHMAEDNFESYIHDDLQLTPDEVFHHNQVSEDVEEVFDSLAIELQEVARLTFYDELTNKEVADILEIPIGTVKSRLNRVRTLARERLNMNDYKFRVDISLAFALFFKTAIDNAYVLKPSDVAGRILIVQAALPKKRAKKLPKKSLSGLGGFAAIATVPFLVQNLLPVSLVNYNLNNEWTNDRVHVEVNLDTRNDMSRRLEASLSGTPIAIVFIDGSYHIDIPYNGDLKVHLDKDLIIDERVGNIDHEASTVRLVSQDTKMTLRLEDNLSGVDWDSVQIIDSTGVMTPYELSNELISFEHEDGVSYSIQGKDLAGNPFDFKLDYSVS